MSSAKRGVAHDARGAVAGALGVIPAGLNAALAAGAASNAWQAFPAPERAVLGALVGMGGAAVALVLVDEAADELDPGSRRTAQEARRAADAALLSLWERGLVARDRATKAFFLLPDVAAAFAAPLRADLLASLPEVEPPPPAIDEHLLLSATAILRHEPARLTREGVPFKRTLEALVERLKPLLPRKDAVARVELVLATLKDLGIVAQHAEMLEVVPEAAEHWAGSGHASRVLLVLDADPSGLAHALLRQLRALGPDRAWPTPVALRILRRMILRDAAAALGAASAAAIGGDATDSAGAAAPMSSSANAIDAALTRSLEALERAGLLARLGGAIALTQDGQSFPETIPFARPETFHVGADLTVLVPRGLDASIHLALGTVARLESADNAARYRLEQALVLDALDAGCAPEDIESLLECQSAGLPDSVRQDLRRWCARFGEVTSHHGIAVACRVPERQGEFAALIERSGLAAALIAPGVAVVEPSDHAALAAALVASGFTPRRTIQRAGAGPGDLRRIARPAPARPPVRAPGPLWGECLDGGASLNATPPPGALVAQLKDKYRREFGSAQLAALDVVELDELLALEEKGGIRQFLSGRSTGAPMSAPRIDEYSGDEMTAVGPVRARQLLEQAAAAGLRCQLDHAPRPGQSTRLLVDPLEVLTDTTGTWLRVRTASGHERLLAIDRIHSLRILRPAAR